MSTDRGWIVPEDVIFQALEDARIRVNLEVTGAAIADYVARVFFNLTVAQQADLVTWFTNNTIRLVHGLPMFDKQELPCIAVIVDAQETPMKYFGDSLGDRTIDTGETVPIRGERKRATIGIACHAENGDLARWLCQWVDYELAQVDIELSRTFPYERRRSTKDLRPTQTAGESGRFILGRALLYVVEFDQGAVVPFTSGGPVDDVGLVLDSTYLSATGT